MGKAKRTQAQEVHDAVLAALQGESNVLCLALETPARQADDGVRYRFSLRNAKIEQDTIDCVQMWKKVAKRLSKYPSVSMRHENRPVHRGSNRFFQIVVFVRATPMQLDPPPAQRLAA